MRIRRENKKPEKHEKQLLPTLKILKRGDDNEFERNLRLKKVVARKQLRLGNDAATKRLKLAIGHGDGRRKKNKIR